MSDQTRPPSSAPTPNPPTVDWASQTADTIDRVIVQFRDRTTRPVLVIARGVVFGLLGAIVGTAVLVMALIGIHRLVALIPPDVWMGDLILGVLLVLLGLLLMSKRKAPAGAVDA